MKVKLDHIGILVENLDRDIIEFYHIGCEHARPIEGI